MADDITNGMLLEHMQAMKGDLHEQIGVLNQKISGMDQKISSMDKGMTNLAGAMRAGFEDARLHRQALQEDLEATMRMLAKHDAKLARL